MNYPKAGVWFYPLVLRSADENVVNHVDTVVIWEPIFSGHLVEREAHHLIEDAVGVGKDALTGENRHAGG